MGDLNPSNPCDRRPKSLISRRSIGAMPVLPFVAACALAAIHVLGGRFRGLDRIPRNRWLSFGSGVSVAYVFVHMLPELEAGQAAFATAALFVEFLDQHVYLIALAGFAVFYGLERLAHRSEERGTIGGAKTTTSESVFWVHIGLFGLYNSLIGYLLVHEPNSEPVGILLFAFAMALHFLVNDYGLRHHHHDAYQKIGRWVLAGGVLVGWALGVTVTLTEIALAVPIAFIGGGILLNVIKEELPEERDSRFWAFALGAGGYATLLLVV